MILSLNKKIRNIFLLYWTVRHLSFHQVIWRCRRWLRHYLPISFRQPLLGPIQGINEEFRPLFSRLHDINDCKKLKPKIEHATRRAAGYKNKRFIYLNTNMPSVALSTGIPLPSASCGGITGTHLGKKFGFEESTTDVERIFSDSEINTVFVTTQHNTHARFVIKALKSDKNVFVEKPLYLTLNELNEIKDYYGSEFKNHNSRLPLLMVGFNRRFAPHMIKMKELLDRVKEPKSMVMVVNAGIIPKDHWTQDTEVGGGRIVGEACHFIDLLRFLVGEKIVKYDKGVMKSLMGDTLSINLSFADGSIGSIHYFANGNKAFPKESLKVFCGGKVLRLNNFKVLYGFGWKGFKKMKLWRQNKGHWNEIRSFVEAVSNGYPSPIPFEELIEVTKTSLELESKLS